MSKYFDLATSEVFQPFSSSHWIVLFLVVAVNILVYLFRSKIRESLPASVTHAVMASLLLFLALSQQAWYMSSGTWSIQNSLPLYLCDISLFVCALMLIYNKYILYEIAYFWGVGGATQALLTPNVNYAFPHFVFFQFFITHAVIVTACLWVTFVDGFRPSLRSVWKAFWVTNIYMLLIAIFNYFTGSNYMFLCQKPGSPSLLDFMGPWPWYVLSGEFVCLLVYLLCYLPFALSGILAKPGRKADSGL
jgi:hypothetical integral membrane protein (TIGR02206 family)